MSSYVVGGASRGLGFEYLRQLSENPDNVVVGLVRNVEAAKEKVAAEINRPNIHLLYADFERHETLFTAATETSKITGGKLDYLIANAAIGGNTYEYTISALGKDPEFLTKELNSLFNLNAVSFAHLINAFMPLVLEGTAKKVIVMTTGMADTELTRTYDLWMGVAYAVSKAALNMIIAKFSAEYRPKGVLVLGISPGIVDTHVPGTTPPGVIDTLKELGGRLMEYEPEWKGMLTPADSIKMVLSVIESNNLESGNAGDMISHHGNKKWL